jgi:hypothetical protein
MTLLDLCDVPDQPIDTSVFTGRVALFFRRHPNEWVPAIALEAVGGRQAWRTRVSDCRKVYGMRIDNRVRTVYDAGRQAYRLSEYRWVVEG